MYRKLIDYLPPVIGEVKEMQLLMEVMQEEVNSLWIATEETRGEAFFDTHTIYGISRWEKMLDLLPKGTDSLETRNYRILARLNERLPFTMRMLKERMQLLVGKENYQIFLNPDLYWLKVVITGLDLKELQIIRQELREMIPLNLLFVFAGRELILLYLKIRLEAGLAFSHVCYPRYNVPYLYYDGTAKYNEVNRYYWYRMDTWMDFYPVILKPSLFCQPKTTYFWKIKLRDLILSVPVKHQIEHICYLFNVRQRVNFYLATLKATLFCQSKPTYFGKIKLKEILSHRRVKYQIKQIAYLPGIRQKVWIEKPCLFFSMKEEKKTHCQVHLTIGYHLTKYNGTCQYNGTRKYDSKIITYKEI